MFDSIHRVKYNSMRGDRRLQSSFGRFVDGGRLRRRLPKLIPQPVGKEWGMYHTALREILLERRLVHITLTDIGSICSIAGLVFAILVYVCSNKKGK